MLLSRLGGRCSARSKPPQLTEREYCRATSMALSGVDSVIWGRLLLKPSFSPKGNPDGGSRKSSDLPDGVRAGHDLRMPQAPHSLCPPDALGRGVDAGLHPRPRASGGHSKCELFREP